MVDVKGARSPIDVQLAPVRLSVCNEDHLLAIGYRVGVSEILRPCGQVQAAVYLMFGRVWATSEVCETLQRVVFYDEGEPSRSGWAVGKR